MGVIHRYITVQVSRSTHSIFTEHENSIIQNDFGDFKVKMNQTPEEFGVMMKAMQKASAMDHAKHVVGEHGCGFWGWSVEYFGCSEGEVWESM